MLRTRFLEAPPPLAGLEMTASVDPAEMGRFFGETARRWVRESLGQHQKTHGSATRTKVTRTTPFAVAHGPM